MSRFGWIFAAVMFGLLALFASTVKVRFEPASASSRPQPLMAIRTDAPHAPATQPSRTSASAPTPSPTPSDSAAASDGVAASDNMVAVDQGPHLTMPVAGADMARITDTWGAPRDDGTRKHQGTDIMAPSGTAVLAAAPGRIEKLYMSKGGGGITIYERSADGQWEFYYAHLGGYVPGLAEGQTVKAGQAIAYVGDTGNAAPGVHHLHFGVSKIQPGDGWWQGQPVNPYPLLLASTAQAR